MDVNIQSQMRRYVIQRLRMHGDLAPLGDNDLLFTSGRLNSLDAVELVMALEVDYGLNFAEIDFDLTLLDSIGSIVDLLERHAAVHA